MRTLIIGEVEHGQLAPSVYGVVAAAKLLNQPQDIILVGAALEQAIVDASAIIEIDHILVIENSKLNNLQVESYTKLLLDITKNYSHILVAANTFGKNLLPRLAALLNVSPLTDVCGIINDKTFKRYIYAGNILATQKINAEKKCLSIRTTSFEAGEKKPSSKTVQKLPLNDSVLDKRSTFIKRQHHENSRPELSQAKCVVSGGRALATKENFQLIEALADKLNAAVGASRAAVDMGLVPNDYQVGQTGKIVAPTLYIAVGISGAIQHVAGMKDSKIIVAINKDKEAPIFQIADYGLVGDLFQILPELISKL